MRTGDKTHTLNYLTFMLRYSVIAFSDLTLDQLYNTMVLRQEVFIVEQDCPYLDADSKDQQCHHVIGVDKENVIQAYARLVPKGISYKEYNSIGRVITSASYRGKGEGKRLMQTSIDGIKKLYPNQPTKISAQVYALPFYVSLGFKEMDIERYDEDGIPHAAMLLS